MAKRGKETDKRAASSTTQAARSADREERRLGGFPLLREHLPR